MAKDKQARATGVLTLSAIGVVMGSIVDAMRYSDVPNDTVHMFMDQLTDGFDQVLVGDARIIMLSLVHVLRSNVASND